MKGSESLLFLTLHPADRVTAQLRRQMVTQRVCHLGLWLQPSGKLSAVVSLGQMSDQSFPIAIYIHLRSTALLKRPF